MSTRHISFFGFLILVLSAAGASGQDKKSSVAKLPQKAKNFLNAYYARIDVASVSEDVQSWFESNVYRVILKDGKRIAFDESGNWKEVDGKRAPLPLNLIPAEVRAYVARSFPRTEVVRMKRNKHRYHVAISNGLQLEFNNKGKFIKIKQQ